MASYVFDWVKWIDSSGSETGTSLVIDASRNIYTTGYSDTIANNVFLSGVSYSKPSGLTYAGYLFQLNQSGDYINNKWLDGSDYELLHSCNVDTSRNIIVCGESQAVSVATSFTLGGVTTTKRFGATGVGVVGKFNSAGTYQWVQTVDGSGNQVIYVSTTDVSNNIYVGGMSSNTSQINISGVYYTKPLPSITTNNTGFITKINSNSVGSGAVQWIDSSANSHEPRSIVIDVSNNIYVAVYILNAPSQIYISGVLRTKPNPNTTIASVLVKYNSNLVYQWHQFIDVSSGGSANVYQIKRDISNNIYVGGYTSQTTHINISGVYYPIQYPASNTGYVIKYNTNGVYQWHQLIDGSGAQQVGDITFDLCNNVLVTGTTTDASLNINISGIPYNTPTRYTIYTARYNQNGVFNNVFFYSTDAFLELYKMNTLIDPSGNLYINHSARLITLSGQLYTSPYYTISGRTAQYVLKQRALYIPLPPTILNLSGIISGVDLSWNSSTYATSYRVQYGISGYYDMSAVFSGLSGTISGLIPGFDYNFRIAGISPDGQGDYGSPSYAIPLYPASISLSGLVSGLVAGNWYNFQIVGVNPVNETLRSPTFYSIPISQAPTGLSGQPTPLGTILTWNSISGTTSYNILYGLSGAYDLSATFSHIVGSSTISGEISGLTPGVYYNFKISATNGGGTSVFSSPIYTIPLYNIPNTPTGLTAVAGIRYVDLSWNSSLGATGYNIYYGISGSYDLSESFTGISGSISELTAGTWYNFKVSAFSGAGESALSSPVYAKPLIATPTGLVVVSQVESVDLSWSSVQDATYYNIYYGLSGVYNLLATFSGLSGSISSLTAGSWYNFVITALNSGIESSQSSPVYAIPISQTPSGLTATNLVQATLLNWSATAGADSYKVFYGLSGSYDLSASFSGSTVSGIISSLTAGSWYNFKIASVNGGGISPYSAAIYAYPIPATPTNFDILPLQTAAEAHWDASVGADFYTIYYGISGSYTNSVTTTLIDLTISGLTGYTTYNFKVSASNSSGESPLSTAVYATILPPTPAVPTGITVTSYVQRLDLSWNESIGAEYYVIEYGLSGSFTSSEAVYTSHLSVSGLIGGSWYNFKIKAANIGGQSAFSSVVYGMPLSTTPTGLAAVAKPYAVDLSWNSSVGATSYSIYYGISGSYDLSASFSSISGSISGLSAGSWYNFVVASVNAAGESPWSAEVYAMPILATPSGFTAVSRVEAVDLSWNAVAEATGYTVNYGISGSYDLSATFSSISGSISSLTAGSWYNFKVRATNATTQSVESAAIYAMPIPQTPGTITSISRTQAVDLSWSAVNGAAQYNIYYGISGSFDLSASFTSVSGTISGLTAGSWYNFAVAAANLGGESPWSAVSYSMPLTLSPSGFTTVSRVEAVDLSWNAVIGANLGYKVYYKISGEVSYLFKAFSGISGDISGLSAGQLYQSYVAGVNEGGESVNNPLVYFIPIARTPTGLNAVSAVQAVNLSWLEVSGADSYTIYYGISGTYDLSASFSGISGSISLTAGFWYNFVIASVNGGGTSPLSSPVYAMPIPATPTGLAAVSRVESIDLSWNASVGAASYTVYYGLSGVYDLSASFTGISGNIGGLTAGSWYNFKVSAIDAGGESPLSAAVYAVPLAQTPGGLVVVSAVESLDISWSAVSGADSYIAYYGLSGNYLLYQTFTNTYGSLIGLNPGAWYNVVIASVNLGGESPWSSPLYAIPLSQTPSAFTVITAVESAIVGWNSVAGADSYKVYYGLSGAYDLSAAFSSVSVSGSISGLTAGVWYNFKIVSVNGGGESPLSAAAYIVPLSQTPSSFVAVSDVESVDLSWSSVAGASSYAVYYGLSGTYDLSASFTGTVGSILGLTAGSAYNFVIGAVNLGGQSPLSAPIYAIPLSQTPSGLTATDLVGAIRVDWLSVAGATGYKIYYGLSGVYDLSASFTGISGIISPLTAGSWYNFKVVSVNGGGESPLSAAVYGMPIPPAPSVFEGVSRVQAVDLSWSDVAGDTGYVVYYGLSGAYDLSAAFSGLSGNIGGLLAGSWYNFAIVAINEGGQSPYSTILYLIPISPAPTGLITIPQVQAMDLSWSAAQGASSYIIVYGLSGVYDMSATTIGASGSIGSLVPGFYYNFKVVSVNGGGQSPLSVAAYGMPIPATPTGLTADPSNVAVSLAWNPSLGATSYNIYYGVSGVYNLLTTSTGTTKFVTGLSGGITYNFKISAIDAGGESPLSAAVYETPLPAIPPTPTGLTAVGAVQAVDLSWNSSPGATSYNIYYDLSGSFSFVETFYGVSGRISPLVPAQVYNFRITADNSGGESAPSAPVYATPLYPPPPTPTGFTVVAAIEAVDMSWNSVAEATYYIVYYGTNGIIFDMSATFLASPGSITNLSGGQLYYFYIVAANPDFESAPSSVQTATPLYHIPAAPVLLSASGAVESVILTWSGPPEAENYYVVYGISGTFDMSQNFPGTGTTGTVTGLTTITTYNFYLVASNAAGDSSGSNILYATPLPPGPPINPSYITYPIVIGHTSITINISVTSDTDYFQILYGEASGNFTFVIDTSSTTIRIDNLLPDHLYNIKVRSYNGMLYVDSDVIYIRTLATPGTHTLFGYNSARYVINKNEADAIFQYKIAYDSGSNDVWQFRTDRERLAYLEGLRRDLASK